MLAKSLPRVSVPLSGDDPDVALGLQDVFQQVYQAGAFERVVNYAGPPTIPLAAPDAQWANELLRSH